MYQVFRKTFQEFPVITLDDIRMSFPGFDTKNLINWRKKGYILKLRNGYYSFSDTKATEYTNFQIANKLYEPSYVSLESALGYYGLIPEGVFSIQSISTRKTNHFTTPAGTFHYHSMKPALYFGYKLISEQGKHPVRMASPEKAILDFLYLRSDLNDYTAIEAIRWNREELTQLSTATLEEYLRIFESPTLKKKTDWLYTIMHA